MEPKDPQLGNYPELSSCDKEKLYLFLNFKEDYGLAKSVQYILYDSIPQLTRSVLL
jgi:hypothetical protein